MSDASQVRKLEAPWGSHPLPEGGEPGVLRVGPLTLWIRYRSDEIWLAHRSGEWGKPPKEASPAEAGPPAEVQWTRWPVPEGTERILLSPAFPPRPLVVEPELSFRLLRGAQARIYVRVPLWVKIELPGDRPVTLQEVPTVILSDTWWGDFTEGELCYWLETQARRRVGPEDFEAHLAVCPLQLRNRSENDLNVEKLALRVSHLSIFHLEGRLWSDETRVRYRGEAEGSDIDMTGKPPEEAPDAARVAAPRTPLVRSFRARTFARLKAIPGLGASF